MGEGSKDYPLFLDLCRIVSHPNPSTPVIASPLLRSPLDTLYLI